MKCRLQVPSFHASLPTTLFASMSHQRSARGHTDSLLSPVPRPGLGLALSIPGSKQNPHATSETRLHSKVQVHALHWKKMPQKESIKTTAAFKCQQQKEREALQHGKLLTKKLSLQVDSGFLLTSQKKRKSHSSLGCIVEGQEREQKQTWKSRNI